MLLDIWHELKKRQLPKSKWFRISFCHFMKIAKKNGQISILSLNKIKVNLIVHNNTENYRYNDECNVCQNSYNFIHLLLSYSEWSILPPNSFCPVLPYLFCGSFSYFWCATDENVIKMLTSKAIFFCRAIIAQESLWV